MFLNRISLLKEDIEDFGQYPFTVPSISNMEQVDLSNPIAFFCRRKRLRQVYAA